MPLIPGLRILSGMVPAWLKWAVLGLAILGAWTFAAIQYGKHIERLNAEAGRADNINTAREIEHDVESTSDDELGSFLDRLFRRND